MPKPPELPRAALTNRAERGLRAFRLMGWASLAALTAFLSLTAAELWAPRTAARLAEFGMLPRPRRNVPPAEVVLPPAARALAAEVKGYETRLRRILLKRRFNVALGIVAVVSFMMFVGSGFLASLMRPHPSTLRDKRL